MRLKISFEASGYAAQLLAEALPAPQGGRAARELLLCSLQLWEQMVRQLHLDEATALRYVKQLRQRPAPAVTTDQFAEWAERYAIWLAVQRFWAPANPIGDVAARLRHVGLLSDG